MTNASPFVPRVVDLSHHNVGTLPGGKIGFSAIAADGIWGVILKSSQGHAYTDPVCAERAAQARDAGLLVGFYHFNTGEDVASQVDQFIAAAHEKDGDLMVLDYEDNKPSQMSIRQAVDFLRLLEQKGCRKPAIYSGNRVKETISQLSSADHAYLCTHRLWLCQYGPRAVLPPGWSKYWLWQYTGDGIGPPPHSIAGVVGTGIDLNRYDFPREQLATEWA